MRGLGRLRVRLRDLAHAERRRRARPTPVDSRANHGDERVGASGALDGVLGAGELGRTRNKGARRLGHVLQQGFVLVGRRRAAADRVGVTRTVANGHLVVAAGLGLTLLDNGRGLLLRLSGSRSVLVPGRLLGLSGLLLRLLLLRSLLSGRLRLSLELSRGLLRLLLLRSRVTPRALLRRRLVTALRLPLLGSRTTPSVLSRLLSPPLLLLRGLLLQRGLLLLRLLVWRLLVLLRWSLVLSGMRGLLRGRALLPLLGWSLLLRRSLLPLLRWRLLGRRSLLLRRGLLLRRALLPLLRRSLLLPLLRRSQLGRLLLLGRLAPRGAALAPVAAVGRLLPFLQSSLGRTLRLRRVAVRGTAVLTPAAGRLSLRLLLLLGLHRSNGALTRSERALGRLRRRRVVLNRIERLLKACEGGRTGGQPRVVGVEGAGVGIVLDERRVLLRRRRSLPKVLLGGSMLWLLRSAFTSLALSAGFLDFVGPLVRGLRKKAVGVEQVVVAELDEGVLVGLVGASRTSSVDLALSSLGPAHDVLDVAFILTVSYTCSGLPTTYLPRHEVDQATGAEPGHELHLGCLSATICSGSHKLLPLIFTDAPTAPDTSETVMRSSVDEKPSKKSSNCDTSWMEPDLRSVGHWGMETYLKQLSDSLLLSSQLAPHV